MLPIPANYTILPFRSKLVCDIRPPFSCYRHYAILSSSIVNVYASQRETYRGHFKVGCDMGWGAPFSQSEPDPAIIRFVRMLQKMGAKANRIPFKRHHLDFWFDISTASKFAFYELYIELGGKIRATVNAATPLLNERTRFLDKELLRKIEILDSFMFAVLTTCNVPRDIKGLM